MMQKIHMKPIELVRLSLIGKECVVSWPDGETTERITNYANGTFYFDSSRWGSSWWYAKYCRVIP